MDSLVSCYMWLTLKLKDSSTKKIIITAGLLNEHYFASADGNLWFIHAIISLMTRAASSFGSFKSLW